MTNFADDMISDSLTSNPNTLPPENTSVFKQFIQSQDEVSLISAKTYYPVNPKDISNTAHIIQKSFDHDNVLCTSMFHQKGHALITILPKARVQYGTDWMFFSFFICLILASIFTFKNNKRIAQLFKAFLLPHFTNQLIREGNIMREFFIYPLLLVYFTSLSFLVSTILNYFFHYEISLSQGALISLTVFLFFIFKISLINVIGWVFHTTKETFEYLTNYLIFSVVIGIFLFPFVFILIYTTHTIGVFLLYGILIIFAIIFIYRSIRGLIIGLSSERYSLYYLFLYLCTVEILPLCISVKLLINYYLTGDFLK